MQYFAAGKKAPELKGDAAQHSATVLAAAVTGKDWTQSAVLAAGSGYAAGVEEAD